MNTKNADTNNEFQFKAGIEDASFLSTNKITNNYNDSIDNLMCIYKNFKLNENQNEQTDKNTQTFHTHQIGTNLESLAVCWHKMSNLEYCSKCEKPFYKANQFSCENCETDQNENEYSEESATSTLNRLFDEKNTIKLNFETNQLTKKSFVEEFSSLVIKNSPSAYEGANTNTILNDNYFPSLYQKDLLEQINLYNKYNTSKLNEIEILDESTDTFAGLIQIHWNLKKPIKLCSNASGEGKLLRNYEDNTVNSKYQEQTTFKATLLKDLKSNQIGFRDDLSNFLSKSNQNITRSQTVKYKSNNSKRASLNQITQENKEDLIIPAYSSVSTIRINNRTTCLNAIKILFEKYHIASSPTEFSLYQVYQSGDTRELEEISLPLVKRLWMGPFVEDKIFIMEKGRELNKNQDLSALLSLPLPLLQSLLENLKQERIKETNYLNQIYSQYEDYLTNLPSKKLKTNLD